MNELDDLFWEGFVILVEQSFFLVPISLNLNVGNRFKAFFKFFV